MATFAECSTNIAPLTPAQICNGFTACDPTGVPMNSAGFNAVIRWIEAQLGSAAAYTDCDGNPLALNAALATCTDMTTAIADAIAALPADKFLQGLSAYNAATNVLTLAMSDGSTVDVDMTAIVADAVASVPAPDGSETIVTAGANVTVTGAGTTASPYVVASTGGGSGTVTVDGESVFGTGVSGSPLNALITNDPTLHGGSPATVHKSISGNMILASIGCFHSGDSSANGIFASVNSRFTGVGYNYCAIVGGTGVFFNATLGADINRTSVISSTSCNINAGVGAAAVEDVTMLGCTSSTYSLAAGGKPAGAQSPTFIGVDSLTVDHTILPARVIIAGPGANKNVAIGGAVATEKLHVYGNILATGTITPSDVSLKENVADDDGAWVLALEPKSYNLKANAISNIDSIAKPPINDGEGKEEYRARLDRWKSDIEAEKIYINRETAILRHGFIAQEVQKVAPELVRQSGDILTVDYQGFISGLVAQVKALSRRIDAAGL